MSENDANFIGMVMGNKDRHIRELSAANAELRECCEQVRHLLQEAEAEIERLKARASRLREELGNRGREITKLSERAALDGASR